MSSRILPGNVLQQGVHDAESWRESLTSSVRSIAQPNETDTEEVVVDPAALGTDDILEDIFGDNDGEEVSDAEDNLDDVGENTLSEIDVSQELTFGNYLPVLVETYDLPLPSAPYTFTYVAAGSELYDAFATARSYDMIGSATRPEQVIQCRHLMVLLGLAE
jgi:hypothetical protein